MGGARFESFVSCNTHDLSSARGLREHWAAMRARASAAAGIRKLEEEEDAAASSSR